MPLHHALFHAAIVAAPLGAGTVLFVLMRRELSWLLSLALALFGMALMFVFAVMLGTQCTDAHDAKLAAHRLLSASELASLRGTAMLCPRVYLFERAGKRECLVADGDGSATVGCG